MLPFHCSTGQEALQSSSEVAESIAIFFLFFFLCKQRLTVLVWFTVESTFVHVSSLWHVQIHCADRQWFDVTFTDDGNLNYLGDIEHTVVYSLYGIRVVVCIHTGALAYIVTY